MAEEIVQQASEAPGETASLTDELEILLHGDRYIRRSQARRAESVIQLIKRGCTPETRRHPEGKVHAVPKAVDALEKLVTDEAERATTNDALVDGQISAILAATHDLLPNGLTEEQARAIATDEDVTLVLAGAGTGKTAVIIGKIAHLVRNQLAAPESILALAFNRKAAIEIRERLPADLKGAHVSTFHSFALRVIAAASVAPTISKMAQDDFAYVRAIEGMIRRMLTDPHLSGAVLNLLSTMTAEYRTPFDFNSPAEYQQYVRDSELRTLNLDLAKSFEELAISNFLSQQGIVFQYEKPYEFETATSERRQYTPDFYLPDHDIYIEHFALNQRGRPPRGWAGYMEGVSWKRRQHAERRTSLIETYSWQHRDETLLDALERQLLEAGVEFDPVPVEELVERISRERISWLAHLLGTFLNHAKSGNLTSEEIEERARDQRDQRRTRHFLDVFHRVRQEYERLLQEERAIDFHDLINQATEHIRQGNWSSPFDHVLIDEFQDISDGRMALAKALDRPDQAYFLVRDDWQSIYRFAGSRVALIHQCDEHLGHTRRRDLTRTFRFGDGILGPSTAFVQRNPEQTQRALQADHQAGDEGITVIASRDAEDGLNRALRLIRETEDGEKASVLVLGRYTSSRRALGGRRDSRAGNVEFSTIHSAKGREADYVIVLDLRDGRYGFPCRVEDDPLLEIVLPPVHGRGYPFAEERRLFYVALTRARRGSYLVADPNRPSPFVRELLKHSPGIRQLGELQPGCPACPRGTLLPSQSGGNLRCSNHPTCRHLAPRCSGCLAGYAIVQPDSTGVMCTNPDCQSPPPLCPQCRSGIVVLRTGPSQFWACTGYWNTPPCTFTAPYRGQPENQTGTGGESQSRGAAGQPTRPRRYGRIRSRRRR